MSVTIPVEIRFNAEGLIPAIIQDIESGQVLMLAYMNRESLVRTLATGETWFYSRSRQELWHKGATSGHRQYIVNASYDCDADALLFQVRQAGVACHEGEFSCFHNPLPLQAGASRPRATAAESEVRKGSVPGGSVSSLPEEDGTAAGKGETGQAATAAIGEQGSGAGEEETGAARLSSAGTGEQGRTQQEQDGTGPGEQGCTDLAGGRGVILHPAAPPRPGDASSPVAPDLGIIIAEVFRVIKERQVTRPEGSYTAYLFNSGQDKILKKIAEEAGETIIASKNDSRREILYELADLYYHTLVLLAYHDLEPGELAAELADRLPARPPGIEVK